MNETAQRAARFLVNAVTLMRAKNHDYGDSWKEMSIESLTDQIKVKVARIQKIQALRRMGQEPQVSEGIRSEVLDIINYAVFVALKLEDEDEQRQGDQGGEGRGLKGGAIQYDEANPDGAGANAQAQQTGAAPIIEITEGSSLPADEPTVHPSHRPSR